MQQFYSWLNELSYFVQRVLSFLLESDRLAEMCDSAHHPMPLFPGVLQPVALGWKSESREGCDTRAASSQPLAAGRARGGWSVPRFSEALVGRVGSADRAATGAQLPLSHTCGTPELCHFSCGPWRVGRGKGHRQPTVRERQPSAQPGACDSAELPAAP